jgi:hypothetical protein
MGSVLKDEDQIQIFIRFSSQGGVLKLLDLFRLNGMNKREKRGKSTKQRSNFHSVSDQNIQIIKKPKIEYIK